LRRRDAHPHGEHHDTNQNQVHIGREGRDLDPYRRSHESEEYVHGFRQAHEIPEEEIFYPAVRAAIDDADLMDEADVEHAGAKELIAQLVAMEPGDDHYDAKVTVLGENIDHHVKEEQGEMFPKAKKAKLDLAALGTKILARKKELHARSGSPVAKKNARAA
jgi:hypothetical protein